MNLKNILSSSIIVSSLLGSEDIKNSIDNTNFKILRNLSEQEVLGYQLYNVEGIINKDIKTSIVKVGKEIEYILPKGVRMKGNEQDIRLFYQVKF